jgi:hypothetical protein
MHFHGWGNIAHVVIVATLTAPDFTVLTVGEGRTAARTKVSVNRAFDAIEWTRFEDVDTEFVPRPSWFAQANIPAVSTNRNVIRLITRHFLLRLSVGHRTDVLSWTVWGWSFLIPPYFRLDL